MEDRVRNGNILPPHCVQFRISTEKGVKQGCVSDLLLFNLYINSYEVNRSECVVPALGHQGVSIAVCR